LKHDKIPMNDQNQLRDTALMFASTHGHLDIVRELLNHGQVENVNSQK
jgi:ankyrin repeat protein